MGRRLRTLTGCSTCRLKRVKCDEGKPICKLCQRHGLACKYGSAQSSTTQATGPPLADAMQRHNVTTGPIHRLPLTKNPSQTSTVFVSQPHFDMTTAWPSMFETSLPPAGKTVAGIVPTIMRLSFRSKPLSAAVAAVVADLMCTVTNEERFACICCDMYLRSVVWLRQEVDQIGPMQDPMHLLTTALILGILEATSFGDMKVACHHLVASMRLWKRCLQLHRSDVEVVNTLRMSLEGCLFFLSSMSVVLPSHTIRTIMAGLDWEAIASVYIEPLGPKIMRCVYSVHRSLQHELSCLLLRVTHASRNAESVNSSVIDTWIHDLEVIEANKLTYYTTIDFESFHLGIAVSDLHIYAIKIFTRHIANPTGCSSDPLICRWVNHACEILHGDSLRDNITTSLFWPLVVILCAVREQDAFESLVAISDASSFNGAFSRCWNRVVETVRQARLHPPCNIRAQCGGTHDGLRLLLQEDGVLSDSDGSSVDRACKRLPSRGAAWKWKEGAVMKV